MSPKYEHTQKGGLLFYFTLCESIILVIGFIVFSFYQRPLILQIPYYFIFVVFFLEFTWLVIMSSSLSIAVDDQYIRIAFGRWAFRKKLLLTEIADCRIVKNDWWWIRFQGRFDIGARKAVELIYHNGKKKRIGTDDPERLADVITNAITGTPNMIERETRNEAKI